MVQDAYEELMRYYEFPVGGELPRRAEFKDYLGQMIAPDELDVFFVLPFAGKVTYEELRAQVKLPEDRLRKILERLAPEGFIQAYDAPQGRLYERGNVSFMTEQQVRKDRDTPLRTFLAEFFNAFIEGRTRPFPNQTPYFRVVPTQGSLLSGPPARVVPVHVQVPDTRQVVPFEILSELL